MEYGLGLKMYERNSKFGDFLIYTLKLVSTHIALVIKTIQFIVTDFIK